MNFKLIMEYIAGKIDEESVIRGFPGLHSDTIPPLSLSTMPPSTYRKQTQDAKYRAYQDGENVVYISGRGNEELPVIIDSFDTTKGKYIVNMYELKIRKREAEPSQIKYPLYEVDEVVFFRGRFSGWDRAVVKEIIIENYGVSINGVRRTVPKNRIGRKPPGINHTWTTNVKKDVTDIGGIFKVGDTVWYYSVNKDKWFEATVTKAERRYKIGFPSSLHTEIVDASKLRKKKQYLMLQYLETR